jgi:hypothetical protein
MNKEELISLIELIKRKSGLKENQISRRLGYDEGHVAQIKNRGPISDKFVNALKREFDIKESKEYVHDMPPSVVSEEAAPYQQNYLLKIIDRLTRTIESQQITINNLTGSGSKKTARHVSNGMV